MVSHPSSSLQLSELRALTCLEGRNADDVLNYFAEHADSEGFISRLSFMRCFQGLRDSSPSLSESDIAVANRVIEALYDVFDSDKNGVVDCAYN